MLHHDSTNKPINVGDYIIIHTSSRPWMHSPFMYGQVTDLVSRGFSGNTPGIKFNNCNAPRREITSDPNSPNCRYRTAYIPKLEKSSTIKLDNVLVVPRDIIDPQALDVLCGVEAKKENISDSLQFIDEL